MTLFADVAEALIAWVQAELPEVVTTHDYPELVDLGPFPDLALDFRQVRTVEGGGGRLTTAHARRKQFVVVLSILVELEPYQDSSHQLWDFADRLIAAQDTDRTLGIKQHGIALDSTPWDCAFAPVTRPDGTTAREMTATATITVPAN